MHQVLVCDRWNQKKGQIPSDFVAGITRCMRMFARFSPFLTMATMAELERVLFLSNLQLHFFRLTQT